MELRQHASPNALDVCCRDSIGSLLRGSKTVEDPRTSPSTPVPRLCSRCATASDFGARIPLNPPLLLGSAARAKLQIPLFPPDAPRPTIEQITERDPTADVCFFNDLAPAKAVCRLLRNLQPCSI